MAKTRKNAVTPARHSRRDRDGTSAPMRIAKNARPLPRFDQNALSLYARGTSVHVLCPESSVQGAAVLRSAGGCLDAGKTNGA